MTWMVVRGGGEGAQLKNSQNSDGSGWLHTGGRGGSTEIGCPEL